MLVNKSLFWFSLFFLSSFTLAQNIIPEMPEAVSNNAVAQVSTEQDDYLISFMGIGSGKTVKDVHNKVWSYRIGDKNWLERSAVPSSSLLRGRLASVAVGIKDKAYIFGGYTVADDHSEKSSPDNFTYDIVRDQYHPIATTPVPVDDAVALVYQQQYIYIVSGWHNDGNVNLVQVYDVLKNTWQQASPFPGEPVFGHAGGIIDNKILVCDGVGIKSAVQKRRTFTSVPACYLGTISPNQITKIDWRKIAHPTGVARYRMAATGVKTADEFILFAGGSDNPYNFNGIGYNDKPSNPNNDLWVYKLAQEKWHIISNGPNTMDHRGMLNVENDSLLILGGMRMQQRVSNRVGVISVATLNR